MCRIALREDMALLQKLGEFLTSRERGYDFAVRDIDEMLTEVRLLLERELDFTREQATLWRTPNAPSAPASASACRT